jgi:S1-C subfamily serine protease/tRNA A-37 threonylcarbamoyl transferase component Bud32
MKPMANFVSTGRADRISDFPSRVILMTSTIRGLGTLAVLVAVAARCGAADEPLTPIQIARIGKAATVLVEVKAARGEGSGSAFCIHPDGWFLTNAHVAQGEITLVLNPSLEAEKSYAARVVRSDPELDLALLRVEGVKDLPALTLGSDEGLEELMEVIAFGYPFGTELRAISVNRGNITALRHKDGRLQRIQLDVVLNPGNSGGPVLDRAGKVIGVVHSGIVVSSRAPARGAPARGAPTGVNFAIPVSTVARFLARPEVQFTPPQLGSADLHKPVRFEARVTPLLPPKAPLRVDLVLKAGDGPERTARMEADGDRYRLTAVPIPGRSGPLTLRLVARFDDGSLDATTTDRTFMAGGRQVALADVRTIQPGSPARVSLRDGKTISGGLSGLDAVPVPVGTQTLSVGLDRAKVVEVKPDGQVQHVACTLVVRHGEKEVYRHTQGLGDAGLLANPSFEAGLEGWTRFSTKGAESQFDLDSNVVREGRQSVRISVTRLSDSGIYQDIMLKPGHRYRFSGWVRTRGLNPNGALVYGTFMILPITQAYSTNQPKFNHGGDNEWTEVAISFEAPADGKVRIVSTHVNFGMGTGTVWFDDLRLVELDESAVSAASQPANGSGLPAGGDARGGDDQGLAGSQTKGSWLMPARLTLYATAILAVLALIILLFAFRRRWWGRFGSRMEWGGGDATAPTAHPDRSILELFAAGRLRSSEMERIGEHLAECSVCLAVLEQLPEDPMVGMLRDHGGWGDASPGEVGAGENRDERPGSLNGVLPHPPEVPGDPSSTRPVEQDDDERLTPGLIDNSRYELKNLLGRGGMGLIYLADDHLENRAVVLKFLREDLLDRPRLVERFRREAAAATLLKHPNIVEGYGIEPFGRWPALVMEYVRGTDLARLIEKAGPVPVRIGCEMIRQAAVGLQYSFEQGMVHRDVKPSNLIVSVAGTVKILDFGLAKMQSELSVDAALTDTGAFLGSVDYMAPEQLDDPRLADVRADIYSLGCTLYHLLSGVPPFPGTTFEVLEAHRSAEAATLNVGRPEVPAELAALVAKMMAKKPGRRFQTPIEVARRLMPFAGPAAARIPAPTGAVVIETEVRAGSQIRAE